MQIRRLLTITSCLMILALLQSSCASTPNGTAYQYCIDQGGRVETEQDPDGATRQTCVVSETARFDTGDFDFTHSCELQAFYEGRCEEEALADAQNPYGTSDEPAPGTISRDLYERADLVLAKLDNTGYTHRPFSLHPDYDGTDTADPFNLFLDCSGFVGAYVTRGISSSLYDKLPRSYSCGPLTEEAGVTTLPARPLAADFADLFQTAPEATDDNIARDSDPPDQICWGRVTDIADARGGDVLVYYHEENIDRDTRYCCAKNKAGDKYEPKPMEDADTCSDGRVIYKMHCKDDDCKHRKNSGHVLFVMERPYRSKRCKDNASGCGIYQYALPGDFQWVVQVADSTTSPHLFDSRRLGADASDYRGNTYTAWNKGDQDPGYVERCNDGSYRRVCSDSVGVDEKIAIDTVHEDTPTGIGAGKMYVNADMDGYRTTYGAKTEASSIFVGRPIRCP